MCLLDANSYAQMVERSKLFDEHMEPMLNRLEGAYRSGKIPPDLPEVQQYLQVCRWPFRRLEYAFALEALIAHLRPGDRYLDTGCGVTPLAQVMAGRGVQVAACDSDQHVIDGLGCLLPETIYGVEVDYATQDLTALDYPDAAFDAVSCISVLEHIPAPLDQQALSELLRVLKPGGLLVLTVDFAPSAVGPAILARTGYMIDRVVKLARNGDLRAIRGGITRKLQAHQAVRDGATYRARTANQCFSVEHLEQDLIPLLAGEECQTEVPFKADLRTVSPSDARRFWDLQPGLYRNQGERNVLPAAFALHKSAALPSRGAIKV
jgi:SAM-dependent methyltransferase